MTVSYDHANCIRCDEWHMANHGAAGVDERDMHPHFEDEPAPGVFQLFHYDHSTCATGCYGDNYYHPDGTHCHHGPWVFLYDPPRGGGVTR